MGLTSVLHETAHWRIEDAGPLPGTRLHLRLSPLQPVDDLLDLSPAARDDYWTALAWIRDGFELTYYCTVAHNGDPRYTGGIADEHACVYLVVGDPTSDSKVAHYVSSGVADG